MYNGIRKQVPSVRMEPVQALSRKIGPCLQLRQLKTPNVIGGKVSCPTNPKIAVLCEIGPRTVHKHVEYVLGKFGVETRTAAVLYTNGKIR